jgi:hypothetical protein
VAAPIPEDAPVIITVLSAGCMGGSSAICVASY